MESTPGAGSTFRVELELRYAEQPAAEAGHDETGAASGLSGLSGASGVNETAETSGASGINEAAETSGASGVNGLEGLHVLVAEDNDINAEILEELLSYEGVSCERTVNGQEAVERFRQNPPGRYDAVLMDVQMPVMNGYEAARAIRSLDRPDAKTIPIVAMTANAFADDVKNSMDAGMNAHLSKPINMAVVKETLEKLIHAE